MARMGSTHVSTDRYECGSCLSEMSGYTWTELQADGWKSYSAGSNTGSGFLMCRECDDEYTVRREMKRAFAG